MTRSPESSPKTLSTASPAPTAFPRFVSRTEAPPRPITSNPVAAPPSRLALPSPTPPTPAGSTPALLPRSACAFTHLSSPGPRPCSKFGLDRFRLRHPRRFLRLQPGLRQHLPFRLRGQPRHHRQPLRPCLRRPHRLDTSAGRPRRPPPPALRSAHSFGRPDTDSDGNDDAWERENFSTAGPHMVAHVSRIKGLTPPRRCALASLRMSPCNPA